MKKIFILFALIINILPVFGQILTGYIYDKQTEETLVGVNVYYKIRDNMIGHVSDVDGYYRIELPDGGAIVNFSFIGYEAQANPVVIRKNQELSLDIYLVPKAELMREVVISAGRFAQELSEVTVSMEVLKPADIVKQNARDLSVLLNTVSGVDVVDKQPSIRGGSGWTYGVGSRSLVLVDGMSVLTPSVGDVNWNLIPMQNIAQIEILKGASSVLYGSSALNGLINIRTERPGLEPQTRLNLYSGIYMNPANENYIWWDKDYWHDNKYGVTPLLRRNVLYGIRNPLYCGTDFSHSRRIGNFDVMLGMDMYTNEGYRQDDYTQRIRLGGNVTHRPKRFDGMNYGANLNIMANKYSGFFIWESAQSPYKQSPLTNMGREGNMFYIDPFFNYINPKNGVSHQVKARYFYKSEQIFSHPTDKSLLDVLADMGFNTNALANLNITEIQRIMREYINADNFEDSNFEGLAGELADVGLTVFPNATAPDLVNLISWIMGRLPFPSDASELLVWLDSIDKPNDKNSSADHTSSYMLDYQFNKQLGFAQFTTGTTYNHITTSSSVTGFHVSDNIAAFFQYDQKFFDLLNLSLGLRLEYYRVDSLLKEAATNMFGLEAPFKPVFRGGLNYELASHTFIRGSFGQGYRYPSLTEKFVYKDIGGIAAYPNPDLLPESGFNAELGIKQGYKIGDLAGYFDLAGFFTQYKNMIEFEFGLFDNETFEYISDFSEYFSSINFTNVGINEIMQVIGTFSSFGLGTRFANVDKARIYGLDASINGIWNIAPATNLSYNFGYVYTVPIDVNWEQKNEIEAQYGQFRMKEKSNTSKYLKYRQKHSIKGVFDFQWNRLSIGTNLTYKTKTLSVDYFIIDERDDNNVMNVVRSIIFSGLHDYWKKKNKGYFTMDFRMGVKISNSLQLWGMINNVLNSEYSVRPMDVSAPRCIILQLNAKF
ncbi:MAG: TonB-dependent receptor [Bacteroidales bacterium]|jgi:outer membrane cobalamin receptor|nr:TonB-dependent receptor [Bacteroidales bacterium]